MDPVSLAELSYHINQLETYISNDFEGKTAHQMTQYIRGHLFVLLDSLMGCTNRQSDLDTEDLKKKHPFEHSLI